MKIGIYISELLYEHDSVILPGFGEFFTKYTPARFIPEAGKVESPSKTIAFNPDKTEGDTPLISYLSQQQDMDVVQVKLYLLNFVNEINQLLASGKKVELERIGLVSRDEQGTIRLEPDRSINYLNIPQGEVKEPPKKVQAETVEATPPPYPSVTTERKTASSEAYFQSETQNDQTDPEVIIMEKEKKHELPTALKWIAFTLVPLLVILIILALNYDYFYGLFKKDRTAEPVVTTQTAEVTSSESETEAAPEISYVADEPVSAPAQPQQSPSAAESGLQQSARPLPGQTVYYIVVGSFPEEAKAERLAESLRNQGAPLASVFMKTGFEYYRVCYGYYYDLAEAEALLDKVKADVNPEAWILHRK